MESRIEEQVYKTIQDICTYIDLLEWVKDQRRITVYLNIEHSIGKYHAFMECLRYINAKKYMDIHAKCYKTVDRGLKAIENLYQEATENG